MTTKHHSLVGALVINGRIVYVTRFTHGDDTYAHACIVRRPSKPLRSQAAPSVPRR